MKDRVRSAIIMIAITLACMPLAPTRVLFFAAAGGLAGLAPGLKAAAEARLAHPEASLAELGAELGVGRSGVNHRLRRLMELAEESGRRRA